METIKLVAGIDIGGTNVGFGLVDANGKIFARQSVKTSDYPQPEQLVGDVSRSIKAAVYDMGVNYTLSGIGIGAPNANYHRGTIEFAPNLKWYGIVPLARMMEEAMGCRVMLTNDANAAAIGEMIFGAAAGMENFLFVTLGTGLGSGIVTDGKMVYGHDGFAGELGHVIMYPDGRLCGCGRKGCLETYCSATGISRTYTDLLIKANPAAEPASLKFDARQIYEKAMAGDPEAKEAFAYTADILGLALANSMAYTAPEVISLSGGLADAGALIFDPVVESFERNLLNIYKGKVKIRASSLPENEAAILGAASLLWNEIRNHL